MFFNPAVFDSWPQQFFHQTEAKDAINSIITRVAYSGDSDTVHLSSFPIKTTLSFICLPLTRFQHIFPLETSRLHNCTLKYHSWFIQSRKRWHREMVRSQATSSGRAEGVLNYFNAIFSPWIMLNWSFLLVLSQLLTNLHCPRHIQVAWS